MPRTWYKLDNAAKVFPPLFTRNDTNGYRLSALFDEEIVLAPLQKALEEALTRFPIFCVRLKKGFFWYYFEHNINKPLVIEENPIVFDSIRLYKNNGFLFTLSYHGRRLSLEVFHALSDGIGSMEFFKAICFNYLVNRGKDVENSGEIKTVDYERNISETEDSFVDNYDKSIKKFGSETKAFQIRGKMYRDRWCGLVHAICSTDSLKKAAHKYEATVTEYIGAVTLFNIYLLYFKDKKQKKNAKIFFPVNARKIFNSNTIRNFALYIRTTGEINKSNEMTFLDMLRIIKDTFTVELNKDKLLSRLVSNVSLEKNFFIRIVPLFIKNIVMRMVYAQVGASQHTISFSNLGIVALPKSMEKHIERFEFSIGASNNTPINMAGISYKDQFVLSFSTKLLDRNLIQSIISYMGRDGIGLIVETNDLEAD